MCCLLYVVPPDAVVIGDGEMTYDVVADSREAVTCRAVGGKPAPTITWDWGDLDVEVEHVAPPSEEDGSGGAVSRSMLTPRKSDNGRQFVCRAVNAAMTQPMQVSARLRVVCEYGTITRGS